MRPEDVWGDFDPEIEPLQAEYTEIPCEEAGRYYEVVYVSHHVDGAPVKVFGYFGHPSDNTHKYPGVLHIHGGLQTASLDHVKFWVREGYACLSYDWTGPTEGREKSTDFGNARFDAQYTLFPVNEKRNNRLYNAVVTARRGITFLARNPVVNGNIGIYGISWGGTVAWIVNGTDDRIKACCPIYGCGGMYRPGHILQFDHTVPVEHFGVFSSLMSPEVYAANQKSPVLMLQSTNDFWGWMDQTVFMMSRVTQEKRVAFTPCHNHYIDNETGYDVKLWMDAYLKKEPASIPLETGMKLQVEGDMLNIVLYTDPSMQSLSVEVFHSAGDYSDTPSTSRNWRKITAIGRDGVWEVRLRFVSGYPLYLYSAVKYTGGFVCGSLPVRVNPPANVEFKSGCPDKVIDFFTDGISGWGSALGTLTTDFIYKGSEFYLTEGPSGYPALSYRYLDEKVMGETYSFLTYKIGDVEKRIIGSTWKLSFWFEGTAENTLTVEVYSRIMRPGQKAWNKECSFEPGTWCHITVSLEELIPADGNERLQDWSQVEALNIKGRIAGNVPCIALLEWI